VSLAVKSSGSVSDNIYGTSLYEHRKLLLAVFELMYERLISMLFLMC
jgi:hypothetical protein